MRLYIGLVHYPVYNKNYQKIASAVTTVDLHDMARVARTYDIRKFFVITPLDDQRALVDRVKMHWTDGYGAVYNQNRKEALELIATVPSVEQAVEDIASKEGVAPLLVVTDARKQEDRSISYERMKQIIEEDAVVLLLFGTAWGLEKSMMDRADHVLEPIMGRSGYQHLSVRSAASIIIDRLAGA